MINFGNKRPPCANPKCTREAHIMVGRQFFCGECMMMLQEKRIAREQAIIMEDLQ